MELENNSYGPTLHSAYTGINIPKFPFFFNLVSVILIITPKNMIPGEKSQKKQKKYMIV